MSRTLVLVVLCAICVLAARAQDVDVLSVIGLPHDGKTTTTQAPSTARNEKPDESKLFQPADYLTEWFYTRAGEKVLINSYNDAGEKVYYFK